MRTPPPPLGVLIACAVAAICTGITSVRTASGETSIAFHRSESPRVLMGRIKISRDSQEVTSHSFEEFAVVEPNDADPTGRRWTAQRGSETMEERLFSARLPTGLIQLPNGHYLTVLRDYLAGVGAPYVLALWETRGDSLVFRGFLDHWIGISVSVLQINEIIPLSPDESLIWGSSQGRDEETTDGTLWVALWRRPLELIMVYRKDWSHHGWLEPDVEVRFLHDFDKESLYLTLELQKRRILGADFGSDAGYSSWKNVSVDYVDLRTLLCAAGRKND
jgi:hypothetical protein